MLATTALALLASALSVAGAPSLSLKVEGSTAVENIDNFQVNTIITNDGDETLRILNDPNGPLSKLPANTFSITNSQGAGAAFSGIKAKYVPKVAAEAGAFTTLAPGASITVAHDLSEAYNLTATGVDTYEIEPANLFQIVESSGEISSLRAKVTKTHHARVGGRLAKVKPTTTLERRASYVSCSAARQTALVSAASAAQSYATNARSYLSGISSGTSRYTTWFGTYTSARKSTVQSHFNAISGNTFSSFTYDCTCTDSGTYAYVYPDSFGRIYLCGAFWNAPTTGTDSKGGTIIHEASHFTQNGGTDDIVYGQTGARNLASSNPNQAIINADNHEYFAENNPALS